MEQYETVQRLGIGACGAVYLVRHINSKRLFALKKIEVDERRKTRTHQAVLKEASILSRLKHPHIVAFHDSFMDKDQQHVCIIQDYCDGGTLADRIQDAASSGNILREKQIMQWFIQIVMAVQYIHSQKVLHRDLKTENVFLTKKNVVKIGDFGISKILDSTIDVAKTVVGTPSYLSPELCQDIPYNSKSDVWAVGCLLYEMCALHPPFDGNSLISLFFKIIKAEFQPVPSHYSAGIHEIVNKILVKAPEDRPSASAILNMPFVKDHLASFIMETESLRKQRVANSSSQKSSDQSSDNSLLRPSTASPSMSSRKAAEGNPRLKSSPLTDSSHPPDVLDLSSVTDTSPATDGRSRDTSCQNQSEETDANSEYSDDFDASSDSEIEEDIQADKEGNASAAMSEEEPQYADDFEEYDSSEELEEVLTQAREAQELMPADDYFEESIEESDDLAQTLTENSFIKS
ncbi:hypothetical protein BaRGS_00008398 [Batillaria attramentaria]|uniref:non-specific serine/threonine protein kinase n=1 Tax=Batillaria attramentaria TaxID=370345 RepID=A0ABD0LMK4_9CAEN